MTGTWGRVITWRTATMNDVLMPLSPGIGSVPAATDFTNVVRDVVGITHDVLMVTPMP